MATSTKLFQPISVGRVQLRHRVAMAPLTRFRADDEHVPPPLALEYYTQRAAVSGTLLIAEATQISPSHCGGSNAPGLWNQAQIAGWRKITDAIHAKGSSIFCQLCAPGRAGHLEGYPLYSSSAVPLEGNEVPQEMTEAEILDCIKDFVNAAKNAMEAGFDGVEIHGANGYLIDQFTQNTCNKRTDRWGGSSENRSRFILEITRAIVQAIGSENVGVRLSPWSEFQDMKMEVALAEEQFSYIVGNLKEEKLAYLHLIESRVNNIVDKEKTEGLEFAFKIWQNQSPILVAGGFKSESAKKAIDEEYGEWDTVIVFGRYFVSTPDLVYRLKHGLEPNPYNRDTFYTPIIAKGYTDYPFSKEYIESVKA